MSIEPLEGEKILITGATGTIARPVARRLAANNEVWGAARFSDASLRRELEDAGVRIAQIDFSTRELSAIPEDVSVVLHYAYTRRPSGDFHEAIEINALGLGHVLARCRQVRAALVVSAATLYSVNDDPYYAYREEDDIGFVRAPWGPSSPVSKVTLEAIARFCAQTFETPTTIVRPSVPYGCSIDMAKTILEAVCEDRPVFAVSDPQPLSLIHIDDMCDQIPALLGAASIPATILNWASDEVFTVQEIAELAGELAGKAPGYQLGGAVGVAPGAVLDTTRVRPIVGPCRRRFREEFTRAFSTRGQSSPDTSPEA